MELQHYVSLVLPLLKLKLEIGLVNLCRRFEVEAGFIESCLCHSRGLFPWIKKKINVVPLALRSSDVAVPHPDKKSVIMYVTSLFQVLPQSISMEAIKEVETLPRAASASIARVTTEEHYQIQTQQRFSQQVRDTHTHMYTHCERFVVTLLRLIDLAVFISKISEFNQRAGLLWTNSQLLFPPCTQKSYFLLYSPRFTQIEVILCPGKSSESRRRREKYGGKITCQHFWMYM